MRISLESSPYLLKKHENKNLYWSKSITPHVSLIECIDNYGAPISIVLIPILEEIIGPIVDPHNPSYFIINSYNGTGGDAFAAISFKIAALTLSVVYFWLQLIFNTIPSWILGWWCA